MKTIGRGKLQDKLYILEKPLTMFVIENIVLAPVQSDLLYLWHLRLDHPSHNRLNDLKKTLLLNSSCLHLVSPCTVCPFAKQKRSSFTSNNHRVDTVFDLVHVDVWSPFSTISHASHRYFLTVVDDYIKDTWVFLLKKKSDVLAIIPKFFKLVKTQYGEIIKTFRSDNSPKLSFDDF